MFQKCTFVISFKLLDLDPDPGEPIIHGSDWIRIRNTATGKYVSLKNLIKKIKNSLYINSS